MAAGDTGGTPRTAVFLGPTLDRAEAARLCPHAEIRPPARRGDLLSAVLDDGMTVLGLIDGEFDQSLSVWHKEVLYALQAGVVVLGASSMGALRAAELHPWGMRGVGRVYEAYAAGDLIDDDEVALAFAEVDGSYLKMSEPMVNIRASCAAAAEAGAVSRRLAERAVAAAKRLDFPERTYRRMCDALLRAGEPADEVRRLRAHLDRHAVDVKADDARLLLRLLAEQELTPAPPPALADTTAFRTLFRRERPLGPRERALTADDIAERLRAAAGDFEAIHEAALDRAFQLMMGRLLRIDPTEEEVDRELDRLRRRHGLLDAAALRGWLDRNRTSPAELRALAREEAVRAVLRRWVLGALSTEGDAPALVDYLRLHNRLETVLAAAGAAGAETGAAGTRAGAEERSPVAGGPRPAEPALRAERAGHVPADGRP